MDQPGQRDHGGSNGPSRRSHRRIGTRPSQPTGPVFIEVGGREATPLQHDPIVNCTFSDIFQKVKTIFLPIAIILHLNIIAIPEKVKN